MIKLDIVISGLISIIVWNLICELRDIYKRYSLRRELMNKYKVSTDEELIKRIEENLENDLKEISKKLGEHK